MLAALLFALAPQSGPMWLDPARYTSDSGAWQLEVDPDDRLGRGGAEYRLLHAGTIAWAGHLPWAFDHAAVSERGVVLGTACTSDDDVRTTELVVVSIANDGRASVRATQEHFSPAPDSPSYPEVRGVRTFEARAEFRVDLAVYRQRLERAVWSYALADGTPVAALASVSPRWRDRTWTPEPARRRTPPAQHRSIDTRAVPIVALERVEEVAGQELVIAPIEHHASVTLRADGALAVLYRSPDVMHLHGADGALRAIVPIDMRSPLLRMSVDPMAGGGWIVSARARIEYDDAGREVQACDDYPRPIPRLLPLEHGPLAGWTWEIHAFEAHLVGPSGAVVRAGARRADGRWLSGVVDAALTSDGALFLLEERGWDDGPPRSALHLVSELGQLSATWDFPFESADLGVPRVHPIGRRVVVALRREGPLVLDRDTGEFVRLHVGASDGTHPFVDALPTPDGKELWVFRGRSEHVERFALPPEDR